MDNEIEEARSVFVVVVNGEEQYSVWPSGREIPSGWREAGKSGPKSDCLAYIREMWTDLRPLSLRRRMEERARGAAG
jgi:MbtH protein